jgi:uncharacterized lipoprotein YmbA
MTKRLPAFSLLFCAFLFCGTLAGCSSSGDTVTRYYLIEPMPASTPLDIEAADLAVAITNLSLPQYLEKFQIASRRESNQLVFASSHQWAESLRKNLSRVLATNLSRLLGTPDVGSPVSRSASRPDVRISVGIENFERGPDGYITVAARWQLSSNAGLTTHAETLRSDTRVDARDFTGTVRTLNDLFNDLSVAIARSIQEEAHDG